jgi:hypothetical protein
MTRALARSAAAAILVVVASTIVFVRPADAAGPPTFTGGQGVAPYTGNGESAVAAGAGEVLVVWRQGGQASSDIFGRFLSPDTSTAQPPFRISQRAGPEAQPDVAWNGSVFLVVWTLNPSTSGDIRGQRIAGDGDFEGGELAISNGPGNQSYPAVAAGGNGQFLVTWQDSRNASTTQIDVFAGRVSASGERPDGTGKRLSSDTTAHRTGEWEPDVAWNGTLYLVVFRVTDTPHSVRQVAVRPNATKARDRTLFTADEAAQITAAVVASDGKDFFVVVGGGVVNDPDSATIIGFVVAGADGRSNFVVLTDALHPQERPTVAYNGSYAVAWVDRRNGKRDIWGTQVARNGDVQYDDGFLITEYYPENGDPALAAAGPTAGTFAVSWTSVPSGMGEGVVAYGFQFAPK